MCNNIIEVGITNKNTIKQTETTKKKECITFWSMIDFCLTTIPWSKSERGTGGIQLRWNGYKLL